LPRHKKNPNALNGAALDPMTAAILAGLKPHIDAAVKEQFTTLLVDMLAKIAPERLAQARPAGGDVAQSSQHQRTELASADGGLRTDAGAAKVPNGAKKNGSGPSTSSSATSE